MHHHQPSTRPASLARRVTTAALACLLLAVLLPAPAQANPAAVVLLRKAGNWFLSSVGGYLIGEGIDHARGKLFKEQLDDAAREELEEISDSTGEERQLRQELLGKLFDQQLLIDQLLETSKDQEGKIERLRVEQRELLQAVDRLDGRVTALEKRVAELGEGLSRLESRVEIIEEALISECRDLRDAPRLGAQGFRLRRGRGTVLLDNYENDHLFLRTRLFHNSCTADLTQRGLLLQLSMATYGLTEELALHVTFKDVDGRITRDNPLGAFTRFELPLGYPEDRLAGEVYELFLPYPDIPYIYPTGPVALALVLTHDGQPIYSLPDQPFNCIPAQQVNCRWRR